MTKKEIKTPSGQIKFYSYLIIITLTLILIMGEITARIFITEHEIPQPPPVTTLDPYTPNPYMCGMLPFMFFHIPGSHYIQSRSYYAVDYHINSSGFRGPEILPKAEGKNRLVIIGDSIVEGHGSEFKETFSWKLNERAQKVNWEVLNLGVQGGSPSYFAANMERYLAADPDAALIVMFENDLHDDRNHEQCYFKKHVMDKPELMYPNNSRTLFLSDISKLSLLIKRGFDRLYPNELSRMIKSNLSINVSNDEQKRLNQMSPWLLAPSMLDTQWHMSRQYLQFTVDKFKARKIPVLIVFLSLGTLNPALDPAYGQHADMINSTVQGWAQSHEIPFFSMVPVIKKMITELPLSEVMIEDDGHPTPMTHSIISDHLWNWLLKISEV